MNSSSRQTIAIIGGGAGGCCSALALARTGRFNIYLLEKNEELMRESSDVTSGRMGLGFHYADKGTALYYLHATIEFSRREILDTYNALKEEYTKMVLEDARNEIFGPPEHFYRILEPYEFEKDVAMETIAMGIETAEELLDWPSLRRFIISQLELFQDENTVTIKTNTEVTEISAVSDRCGYVIDTVSMPEGDVVKIFADITVNASWYNIAKFNKMVGISAWARKRCNRIKAIATVHLPEDLANMPSMFFLHGPLWHVF
ncbi:hypothetical protein OS493_032757 [Desmophyllum pertusum]|uniref:FAD dependent oxidoreductase domain-containing protein n=1 Tax=Desmophyllum pertusum TaxID=174260 RepID=A0A9X0D0L3_9CNID|nr:hypothetical protein OS493_032757 [Desmophyllum pertusum]